MNFGVNRAILISGFVIVTLTLMNQLATKKNLTVTRVIVGADVACLVLAFVDMIPGAERVTTGIALVAMLTSILAYGANAVGLLAGATKGAAATQINPLPSEPGGKP